MPVPARTLFANNSNRYNVMLCCWKMEPLLRPDFIELRALLDSMHTEQVSVNDYSYVMHVCKNMRYKLEAPIISHMHAYILILQS